jgi:hypothetical protein
VHEIIADLLQRQQRSGFPDLAGTTLSGTVPVADRLINEAIAKFLPASGAVQEVRIESEQGNQIQVKLRVSAGRLSLPFTVTLHISAQPELPHRPILELRLAGRPLLLSMAGPLTRFLDVLPPGITMEGERIAVDLQLLLAHYGRGDLLPYLTDLRVTTATRRLVAAFQARLPPGETEPRA